MSARTGIYDEAGVGHPATSARLYEAIRAANKIKSAAGIGPNHGKVRIR